MHLAEQVAQSPCLLKNESKARQRIKQFFSIAPPFDTETLCQVMVIKGLQYKSLLERKVQYKSLSKREIYDILYQFFVDGYSQSLIAAMHNLSVPAMMWLIYRRCAIVQLPKYNWLFQPVKRRSKEEKQQELKDRIADIAESQSLIDLTEIKE